MEDILNVFLLSRSIYMHKTRMALLLIFNGMPAGSFFVDAKVK